MARLHLYIPRREWFWVLKFKQRGKGCDFGLFKYYFDIWYGGCNLCKTFFEEASCKLSESSYPDKENVSTWASSSNTDVFSLSDKQTALKTPTRPSRNACGCKPASKIASYAHSIKIRPCGSMECACLAWMPKNGASNLDKLFNTPFRLGISWHEVCAQRASSSVIQSTWIAANWETYWKYYHGNDFLRFFNRMKGDGLVLQHDDGWDIVVG